MRSNILRVVVVLAFVVICHAHTAMAGIKDVYWAPTELSNTIVWLDASDLGTVTTNASGQVSQWADKSGNSNHQLQATLNNQPKSGTRNINGVNAIDFDGADDTMQEASSAFGSVISNTTVFVVGWFDTTSGNILSLDASFGFSFRYGDRLATSVNGSISWDGWMEWYHPHATNLVGRVSVLVPYYSVSENVYKNYVDGEQSNFKNTTSLVKTANGTDATTEGIKLGTFDGLLGEVVILDDTVSTNDRQIVEGYLAWKWEFVDKLPLDHPFKEEPPNNPPAGTVITIR